MRALVLSACLLSLPLLPLPVAAQESPHVQAIYDLSGRYAVEGRNPDGSAYTGWVELVPTGSAAYDLTWTISGQAFRGQGQLDGRVLTVQWQGDSNPVVYVVMPDGELHGTWADGRALDRLSPAR